MRERVKLPLAQATIGRLKARLIGQRDAYAQRCDEYCRRLAEIGAEAARAAAPEDSGELRSSIEARRNADGSWEVSTDCWYADFVEFGTGVVGEGTYPDRKRLTWAGWSYDQRRTPEAHDPEEPEFWYWVDDDGRRHRTSGYPARPFMLPGALAMRETKKQLAREVFGHGRY